MNSNSSSSSRLPSPPLTAPTAGILPAPTPIVIPTTQHAGSFDASAASASTSPRSPSGSGHLGQRRGPMQAIRQLRRAAGGAAADFGSTGSLGGGSSVPFHIDRLRSLFGEIENEVTSILEENQALRRRLERYEPNVDFDYADEDVFYERSGKATPPVGAVRRERISRNTWTPTRKYLGHRDCVWEVTMAQARHACLGTASADRTARLWSPNYQSNVYNYAAHKGSVNSIRFHATDSLVCTASGDRTVHVWRIPAVVTKILGQASAVPAEAQRRNSISGATIPGIDDLANLTGKVPLVRLSGHGDAVSAADWYAGGTRIVSAGWDKAVHLWDAQASGSPLSILPGHQGRVTGVAVHATDDVLATSSADGTVRLWDPRKPTGVVDSVKVHAANVTSVVFSRTDSYIVTASDDRYVKVWNLKFMRSPISIIRNDAGVNRIAISPVGNLIAAPLDDGGIRIFDVSGGRAMKIPRSLQGHRKGVTGTAWAHDDAAIFSSGYAEDVFKWEPSWGAE